MNPIHITYVIVFAQSLAGLSKGNEAKHGMWLFGVVIVVWLFGVVILP